MFEINKYIDNNNKLKFIVPKIGDEIEVEYYSKISGIQLRKFNGICIAVKNSNNINNIWIELLNINKQSKLLFKFYLNWNQLLTIKKKKINNLQYRKSKLYYLINK